MAKEFELEFYKLHRAHEVALNTATATYEQSVLRLILVLNGAAIAALLALIQTVGACSYIMYNFGQAKIAIDWWVGGVGVSFLATSFAYWSQREFTKAYRSRRTAIEAEAMSTDDDCIDTASRKIWRAKRLRPGESASLRMNNDQQQATSKSAQSSWERSRSYAR